MMLPLTAAEEAKDDKDEQSTVEEANNTVSSEDKSVSPGVPDRFVCLTL